uniref:YtkA-like domain-containing protein n=1 Tax=Geobacter sp. (strain M21) TaxID=443144 RepID=C6E8C3_GEOSM
MKKLVVLIAAAFALSAPMAALAMEHGSMKMEHGHDAGVAHEEVVKGVKATFKVMSMKEHMKAMKMEMPKGMKETHHIAAEFKDAKTGKALTEGEVTVKVQSPDKSAQTKDLMGMEGHFGADFDLSKKGKYGVMCKFKLKDGQVRSSKFWYTVK